MNQFKKIFFALVLFSHQWIAAQTIVDLKNVTETGNVVHVARDLVHLENGYNYKPSTGQSGDFKIDASIVGDVSYTGGSNPSNDITQRSINTSCVVGLTQGTASVTSSGGATYSIPFAMPAGTNGMMPSVGISYNSQGGNGLLGMGWGLSAGSVITRAGQTIYHNGKTEGVHLTNADAFVLDGQRLIPVTGNNGANGTYYGTEQENFSRISSLGTSGNGPATFLVETKSGEKIEYGTLLVSDDNARLKSADNATVVVWYIRKVTDPNGNYMTYSYNTVEGEIVLLEINYTGNDVVSPALKPFNKVKFYYNKRSDINSTFIEGKEMKNALILDRVAILSESSLFREYRFKYAINFYSFLTEITETGSDGTKFNSTMFQYGPSNVDQITEIATAIYDSPFSDFDISTGDFNGDGISDILACHKSIPIGTHNYLRVYTGSPSGNYSLYYQLQFDNNYSYSVKYKTANYDGEGLSGSGLQNGDFDGNGTSDIVILSTTLSGTSTLTLRDISLIQFPINYVPLSTVTPYIFQPGTYSNGVPYYNKYSVNDDPIVLGDFNGDGATEIITFTGDGSTILPRLYTLSGNALGKEVGDQILGFGSDAYAGHFKVIDSDGDRKNELVAHNNAYQFSYRQDYISYFTILKTTEIFSQPGLATDFNGDGKTDFITGGGYGDPVQGGQSPTTFPFVFYFSTGTSTPYIIKNFPGFDADQHYAAASYFKTGDFNGDGKADLLFIPDLTVYYFTGTDFVKKTSSSSFTAPTIYASGDFNGDGTTDFFLPSGTSNTTLFLNKDSKERLLNKISDGFNNLISFDYLSMASGGSFYTRNFVCNFPNSVAAYPIYLVSSHKVPDGIGGIQETTYKYENAIFHKQGKGFLGFLKNISSNVAYNQKNTNTSQLNTTYGLLLPSIQEQSTYNGSFLKSKTTYASTVVPFGAGKRIWVRADGSTAFDGSINATTVTVNSYNNNYGNITLATVNVKKGTAVVQTNTTTTQYGTFGTWIPAHLTNLSSTSIRGTDSYTKISSFAYDTKGNLTSHITDVGDAKQITSTCSAYNDLGQALNQTVSAAGVPSLTSSMEYDAKGRVTKKYSALQQFEEYTYDNFGRLSISKDIIGLTTTYAYDGFSRLIKTISPTGLISSKTLGWESRTDVSTLYYSQNEASGSPVSKTWFDVLGKEKLNMVDEFQQVYTYRKYNNIGNVLEQSAPYISGQTPIKTTFEYVDNFYRVTKATTDGISVPITYEYVITSDNQLKTKVTSPQGLSVTETDVTGKMVSASDNGGPLSYEYYSSGNLKSVSVGSPSVTMVSMEYDIQGNRTKLVDKNSGTINSTYDAFGKIISEDDNGKSTTMFYYDNGKIKDVINAEGTTHYDYNTEGKAINQIKKITSPGSMVVEYAYSNDFGRLIKAQETVAGEVFAPTQFEYNTLGQQTKTIYPSGFAIKNFFSAKGELYKITDNAESTTIWQRVSKNAFGKCTEYTTGNGKTTKKTYDNYGMPLRFSADGVYDLQMEFDAATGNLKYRKNNPSLQEDFTYDNLNRLKTAQVTGQTQQAVFYEANGNIQKKSDAGTYAYDQNKINAVTTITPPIESDLGSSSISPLNQLIEYTSFNKAKKLTENNYELSISYGTDQERRKATIKQNTNTLLYTRYYLPGYEKTVEGVNTTEVNYISSPDGLVAIYVQENGVGSYHYLYSDHLGSPVVVTNSSGAIEYKQSFDAWGRKRNPDNWTYDMSSYTTAQPKWMYRGFTGHEMLPQFTLINMNGRMYDAILGRMLSADNYIQDGGFSQSYNRYSYVWNNPLRYTDPTGNYFGWDDAIAMALGGVINVACNAGEITDPGQIIGLFMNGAIAGELALYGPAGWALGGSFLSVGNAVILHGPGSGNEDRASGTDYFNAMVDGALFGLAGGIVGEAVIGPTLNSIFSGVKKPLVNETVMYEEIVAPIKPITPYVSSDAVIQDLMVIENPSYLLEAGELNVVNSSLNREILPVIDNAGKGFKSLTELGLSDGMTVSTKRALELGEEFLGKGYKELVPGSGRYVSADGTRVVRMGTSDITGAHGGGPHLNFETLIENPAKAYKMMVDKNFHIYLNDYITH